MRDEGACRLLLGGRLVYDSAGADNLAQEGVAAGVVVLTGRIADGLDAAIALAPREPRNNGLALIDGQPFEVRRNDGDIDIAPLMRTPVNMRAVEDYCFHIDALLKVFNEA